nr:hypothetical protein CFP56_10259 [Quercus suber]
MPTISLVRLAIDLYFTHVSHRDASSRPHDRSDMESLDDSCTRPAEEAKPLKVALEDYLENVTSDVGLPLSDRDAEALVEVCHLAPFGKGEDNIVDTSVCKTWELSPDDFELRDPAWDTFSRKVVTRASADLQVDQLGGQVSAELRALQLDEEGSIFEPDQDSKKDPNIFGTLVIALPSKHEGGDVHFSHAGVTTVLNIASDSDYGCTSMAWFSDVTHEVKPITSGRRLLLTYNLRHKHFQSHELSAGNNDPAVDGLISLLDQWEVMDPQRSPTYFFWVFDRKYDLYTLDIDSLEGRDRGVAVHLRDASHGREFALYFADVRRERSGYCDSAKRRNFHRISEVWCEELQFRRINHLDGGTVAEYVTAEHECKVPCRPFDDADPHEEDYEGLPSENGEARASHFHRYTVQYDANGLPTSA